MIYVFLANGFEESEALTPVDVLRRAELDVQTVGVNGKTVRGSHGISVTADIDISEVTTENLEMIVLPGGMPGTLNLEKDPIVRVCINYCNENDKYISAICAAPSILGHMGILEDKKATCFTGFEGELYNAEFTGEPVTVDGKIITARGAGVSLQFALRIVSEFAGEAKAKKIHDGMRCE